MGVANHHHTSIGTHSREIWFDTLMTWEHNMLVICDRIA
jgi:hypothetical protein